MTTRAYDLIADTRPGAVVFTNHRTRLVLEYMTREPGTLRALYHTATATVGTEPGIEPGIWYTLDADHHFTPCTED